MNAGLSALEIINFKCISPEKGVVYLVGHIDYRTESLHPVSYEVIKRAEYFICESPNRAFNFLVRLKVNCMPDVKEFSARNLRNVIIEELLEPALSGKDIVVLSDTGLPSIGDPANIVVQKAHEYGIPVRTLPSPSPIIQFISSMGSPYQRFFYYHYLPVSRELLKKEIGLLLKLSREMKCSIIFIESPHRTGKLLHLLIEVLPVDAFLALGKEIGTEKELIISRSVEWWRKNRVNVLRGERVVMGIWLPSK